MPPEATLSAYAQAWGTADEGARRALLETCWSEDGVYQDPKGEARGREALVQRIGGILAQMPGARVELTSGISHHHDKIFFAWRLVAADGSVMVEGIDFGVLAGDGRLVSITGFFGPPGA